MKSFRIADIGTSVLYSKKYLNETANSTSFLKSITYNVGLSNLLQIKKTCTYHYNMEYVPVIVEIIKPELREHYGGNYMLQVYDTSGECIYMKLLQHDIISWNIFFNALVFKLDSREPDSQWIYVVRFKGNTYSVVKVQDIINDPSYTNLGFVNDLLYVANQRDMKIFNIDVELDAGQTKEIIPQKGQYSNYQINGKCKLLAFMENKESFDRGFLLCLVETSDYQVDFVKLNFNDRNWEAPNITFQQYREIVKRYNVRDDPIMKTRYYIDAKDRGFACAHRLSGQVDFYYDYSLIDSSEEKFLDMEMNSLHIFLKYRKMEKNPQTNLDEEFEKCLQIELKNKQRIGVDAGVDTKFKVDKWYQIMYDLIRYNVKLFTAITLVNTNFFVSYNNVVSIYDIVRKEWKAHFFFEDDVVELLRNQRSSKQHDLNIVAYLSNGTLRIIDCPKRSLDIWEISSLSLKIEGKLLRIVSDWRDISSHYILTQLGSGKMYLVGFQKSTLTPLNQVCDIQEGDELIRCITPNEQEDFVLLNRQKKIIRSFVNPNSFTDHMIVQKHRSIKIQSADVINGYLHSVVGSLNEDYLLLFNRNDIFKLKIDDGTIAVQKDFNIQSIQVIDVDYCYSLSNESGTQSSPGFYIQNVNAFIEKASEASNFKLKAATVGINDLLDYYKEDQRIAYMSSYESIKIVPVLHRNVIGFIGMKPREEYVVFKRVRDRLIALDRKGRVTTWSVLTGKVLEHRSTSKSFDMGDFEVFQNGEDDITYRSGWYQPRVLCVDRKNKETVNEIEFFGERLQTDLGRDSSYVNSKEKEFFKFKLLELLDNAEVRDHFSFIHPYYGDDKFQRLFFSDDLNFMIERQEQNVFYYRRIDTIPNLDGQEIKWQLIRRLKQFPLDLSECTFVNYIFSPSLEFYLDFDKSDNIFVIKKSEDQSIYCKVPSGLMNPGTGKDISLVGKKFKWLDNKLIRVINNEGLEKTVDVSDDCKEISYCGLPMLDINYLRKEEKSHFFYDMSITKENETFARLKRKYQEYFSAYYSDGMRNSLELYEILFKVDFNVDNCRGKLLSDVSFTYFHWKLAEMMQNQPRFNIKRYHPEEIKILSLNVFPKGNTVLHYAYKNLNIIRRFYKVIEAELQREIDSLGDGDNELIGFEIPFIKNFQRKTALHLCIENENYKSADIILSKLQKDPIESHARSIQDILPKIVEAELPCLGDYFDSRFQQTQILKDFRRGALKYENDLDYAMCVSELWPDKNTVKKSIFIESKVDAEVKLEFLDVAGVHCYQEKVGDQFFDALANCKNIDIFKYRSIQAIIDYKWPLAREYTIKLLFIPFCIYLAIFIVYSNVFNGQVPFVYGDRMWVADKVLSAFLYCFSIYFLQNECRQIYLNGLSYFQSVWNYSDLVPPCFIIVIVSIHIKVQQVLRGVESDYADSEMSTDDAEAVSTQLDDTIDYAGLASIHSIACLLMWVKLLYFLRIFKQTGYLVRMLTEVIADMKVFLLILCIVLLAFSEAFMRLSEMSDPDQQFHVNYAFSFVYTFRLAVGDTGTDTFNDTIQPVIIWIYFAICLLLTNVVLLNLLIAIISESFNKINSNAVLANYQERARIIAENSYLIPMFKKKQYGNKNQYLLIARELTEQEENDQEDMIKKIREIESSLAALKKDVKMQNETIITHLQEILLSVKK